jgi:hypothetical protein
MDVAMRKLIFSDKHCQNTSTCGLRREITDAVGASFMMFQWSRRGNQAVMMVP